MKPFGFRRFKWQDFFRQQNISLHIKNVFEEGELQENATVKDYLTVQAEGKREAQRNLKINNLDVIISVGYRVKSHRGTQSFNC